MTPKHFYKHTAEWLLQFSASDLDAASEGFTSQRRVFVLSREVSPMTVDRFMKVMMSG